MSKTILSYTSYQLQNGKWTPKVTEREYFSDRVEERPYIWDELFDSKEEADEFAKIQTEQKSE